jgi:DNA-binding CsgD family transcriptional regulator
MTAETTAQANATRRPRAATISVADYLQQAITLSGKSQSEIAREAGFAKPNVITMFKQGLTKVPLSKVGALAKAMGVDPMHLFKLVMNEYEPDTWASIQNVIMRQPAMTQAELEILQVIRESNVINPRIRTDEERQRLLAVIDTFEPDGVH